MAYYRRSTRECSVSQLTPTLLQADREYFQSHNLGDLETEVRLCCETISEMKTGSWLTSWLDAGEDSTIHTGILLTGQALVWMRDGNRSGVRAVGAKLINIHARAYSSLFSHDAMLEISGLLEDSKSNIRGVIALGPEAEAQKFCEEVHLAIEKVNPTPPWKWPPWLPWGAILT